MSEQTDAKTRNLPEQAKSPVDKFVKAVVRRNVQAVLPQGTAINRTGIPASKTEHFYDCGPDDNMQPSRLGNPSNINKLLNAIFWKCNMNHKPMSGVTNYHIISLDKSEQDPENKVLSIYFYQTNKQLKVRYEYSPAWVMAEMPEATMTEFTEEIQKNPDMLEDFYQQAFAGLDGQDDQPGMRRLPADGFVVLGNSTLKLEGTDSIDRNDISSIKTYFGRLPKYQYQNGPYGTGYIIAPK